MKCELQTNMSTNIGAGKRADTQINGFEWKAQR